MMLSPRQVRSDRGDGRMVRFVDLLITRLFLGVGPTNRVTKLFTISYAFEALAGVSTTLLSMDSPDLPPDSRQFACLRLLAAVCRRRLVPVWAARRCLARLLGGDGESREPTDEALTVDAEWIASWAPEQCQALVELVHCCDIGHEEQGGSSSGAGLERPSELSDKETRGRTETERPSQGETETERLPQEETKTGGVPLEETEKERPSQGETAKEKPKKPYSKIIKFRFLPRSGKTEGMTVAGETETDGLSSHEETGVEKPPTEETGTERLPHGETEKGRLLQVETETRLSHEEIRSEMPLQADTKTGRLP